MKILGYILVNFEVRHLVEFRCLLITIVKTVIVKSSTIIASIASKVYFIVLEKDFIKGD
jgi:hypothetical protein